jgi:hypothetical protein
MATLRNYYDKEIFNEALLLYKRIRNPKGYYHLSDRYEKYWIKNFVFNENSFSIIIYSHIYKKDPKYHMIKKSNVWGLTDPHHIFIYPKHFLYTRKHYPITEFLEDEMVQSVLFHEAVHATQFMNGFGKSKHILLENQAYFMEELFKIKQRKSLSKYLWSHRKWRYAHINEHKAIKELFLFCKEEKLL